LGGSHGVSDEQPQEEIPPLTDEEAARIGRERLRRLLVEGGKVVKTYRCVKCNSANRVELEVMDADAMLRTQKYFDDVNQTAPGDVEAAGQRVLRDLAEMPTEELAKLYASLEGADA
jgi:hypothetical protein